MPIHAALARHAAATPDKPAFVIGGEHRSYGELYANARAFTAWLDMLPANPARTVLPQAGRITALALGNHPRFAELFAGATAPPHVAAVLDPALPRAQIEDILARLVPDMVVVDAADGAPVTIGRRLGLAVATAGQVPRASPAARTWTEDGDDGPFLIGFTSGTTAQPKAFSRSRLSWRRSLDRGRALFRLGDAPATLCPGALAQGVALYALAEALDAGATFHGVPRFDRHAVGAALAAGGIERLVAVPTMIQALAKPSDAFAPPFPAMREVVTAGAKLDAGGFAAARRLFPAARISEYYGASELSFVAAGMPWDGVRADAIERVGRAFPGVTITIVGADGAPVPPDAAGTIAVRSDLVCDGYLWGEDGSGFHLGPHGASVGDLGRIDADGYLEVLGRAGGMIVSGGVNIYPAEIENVLKAVPGIEEAVVIGVADPYLGQRAVAVVSGTAAGLAAVTAACADGLPRQKIPRQVYKVEAWPLTAGGKIARQAVEQAVREGDAGLVPLPA